MTRFVRAGDRLPPITLPDLDGEKVSLISFVGKRLVVFMWASW
ncbi:MAG: peroxiredoxin family protein [Acidimicrobiia bacterium]